MKKITLALLVGLTCSTSAHASYTLLDETDTQAYEAPNYDGGVYGSNA